MTTQTNHSQRVTNILLTRYVDYCRRHYIFFDTLFLNIDRAATVAELIENYRQHSGKTLTEEGVISKLEYLLEIDYWKLFEEETISKLEFPNDVVMWQLNKYYLVLSLSESDMQV